MSGHREREQQSREKDSQKLKNYPSILHEYYSSLVDSGKSYTTVSSYIDIIIGLYNYLKPTVNSDSFYKNITVSDIINYLDTVQNVASYDVVSNSAKATRWSVLNSFFNFLTPQYIPTNPMVNIPRPSISRSKEMVYLTAEELALVFGNARNCSRERAKNRDLSVLMLGFYRGLSSSAIQNLNISDLDLDKNRLWIIDKSGRSAISLSSQISDQLRLWLEDREKYYSKAASEALFVSQSGTRISNETVCNIASKYAEGTGKTITAQVMKNTCVVNLYKQTGDINLCAKFLKHKQTTTTQRYIDELMAESRSSVDSANKIMGAMLENSCSETTLPAPSMHLSPKAKCTLLRVIRQEIAQLNGIDFTLHECPAVLECPGTCPLVAAEIYKLNEALNKLALSGVQINVANLTLNNWVNLEKHNHETAPVSVEEQLSLF